MGVRNSGEATNTLWYSFTAPHTMTINIDSEGSDHSTFLAAYTGRLAERGEDAGTCAGIAGRAHVFEAALLLKIAARRVNRLHSPRAGEVAAVVEEVDRSLELARRSAGSRLSPTG